MSRHVFLTVLIASIIAVVVGVFLSPSAEQRKSLGFPWEINVMPDGTTSVFQINLSKTSLGEAERLFKEIFQTVSFV